MYEIKILTDSEFESLPYPDMDVSLGVADPRTNTAYVRYTASDELNKYLINHELEHLVEGQSGEHAAHYENGVYYKKFGEVLQNIVPTIGGFLTGGPMGAAAGALSTGANVIQSRNARKQQAPQISSPSGPMEGFSPSSPTPIGGSPNIVTPGSPVGSGGAQGAQGGSVVDRIRGFFQGRNPVGQAF